MKALVTGGSGFCGINLIKELLHRGHEVRNLDIADINEPAIEQSIEFIKSDIRDEAAAGRACRGTDVVFHCAAIVPISRSNKMTYRDIDVNGTRIILESSLKAGVKRVVFISSSAPYGIPKELPIRESTEFNPVGDYGRSKMEAEELCTLYRGKGLDVVILRPRATIGMGRLGIFQILYNWIADGKNIYIIGKGNNRFQLLSIFDLVQACLLAIEKPCKNEDFNLGAEVFATVRQDLEALTSYANTGASVISIPAGAAKTILKVLDKLNLSPLVKWHYLTSDKPFYFDISKAKKILGLQPRYSNIEMLKEGYEWYLSHRKEIDSEFGTTHRKSARQGILKILKYLSHGKRTLRG